MELPLEDGSVDAVINVESCHHYASMPSFLSEVRRVLRPGGHLLITDYREVHEMPILERYLAECGMPVCSGRDITANVLAALDADEAAKQALLEERVPRLLRGVMRTFMGCKGTDVYAGFAARTWLYQSWVLQKQQPERS